MVLFGRERICTADLTVFLFARLLYVDVAQFVQTAVVAVVVLGLLAALHEELVLRAFDPDGAAAAGYRIAWLDLVLNLVLVLVLVAAVRAVGGYVRREKVFHSAAGGFKIVGAARENRLMTSGTKRCCTCRYLKPLTEFNKRASSSDGLQARCRACSREWYLANKKPHKAATRKRNDRVRLENWSRMIDYLQENPCTDCGESDIRALDFDHRPGVEKVANVTRLVAGSYAWDRIFSEISKCDVRCANCHRKVTCERASSLRQKALDTLKQMPD